MLLLITIKNLVIASNYEAIMLLPLVLPLVLPLLPRHHTTSPRHHTTSLRHYYYIATMKQPKTKSYKRFIKDLVYNNPRADRQAGTPDGWSKDVLDNQMLYDNIKNK